MTTILFYLPAITANWFNDSVVHLIRAAAREAEVHVVVPVAWNGTGITENELAKCLDLDSVNWVILDGDDHPSYRTGPDDPSDIIAFAHALDPDYVFCRSADVATPLAFPGKVVFLMEAEFAPSLPQSVPRGGRMMVTGPRFYDFGLMPALDARERDWLDTHSSTAWDALTARATVHGDRAAYLARVGLPADRPIIALPIQYQGADNLFGQMHGSQGEADLFVAAAAAGLDADCLIAVTVHPIDRRQRTFGAIDRIAGMDAERVRIIDYGGEDYQGEATERLIQHCDGLILAESKSVSLGAFYGKPMLRLTDFATAPWVNAYSDLPTFASALRGGTARVADPQSMRLWHAWHFANNAFVAAETDIAELLDRADRPSNPARWPRALARHNGGLA